MALEDGDPVRERRVPAGASLGRRSGRGELEPAESGSGVEVGRIGQRRRPRREFVALSAVDPIEVRPPRSRQTLWRERRQGNRKHRRPPSRPHPTLRGEPVQIPPGVHAHRGAREVRRLHPCIEHGTERVDFELEVDGRRIERGKKDLIDVFGPERLVAPRQRRDRSFVAPVEADDEGSPAQADADRRSKLRSRAGPRVDESDRGQRDEPLRPLETRDRELRNFGSIRTAEATSASTVGRG